MRVVSFEGHKRSSVQSSTRRLGTLAAFALPHLCRI